MLRVKKRWLHVVAFQVEVAHVNQEYTAPRVGGDYSNDSGESPESSGISLSSVVLL